MLSAFRTGFWSWGTAEKTAQSDDARKILRMILSSREERRGIIISEASPPSQAGSARRSLALDVHPARRQELLQPVDVVEPVLDIGVAHQRAKQRQGRFDAVDDE